jgi:hypothetical protein
MKHPIDFLALALRNLRVGEELFCTPRTYTNVSPRVQAIQHDHPPLRFNMYQKFGLGHIRRTR